MTPERWHRVREVFAAVTDLPAGERVDALHELSSGDVELRSIVGRLIERHESSDGLLGDGLDHFWLLAEDSKGEPLLSSGDLVSQRFEVQRLIGRGGMGEVYACADRELGQTVALKALRPQAEEEATASTRFKREIQLARQVTHSNVCRVFDLGRHQGSDGAINFFTMEYVEGETLADYLRREGRIAPQDAKPVVIQIAAGLHALHRSGIVHRDLKPSNVLLESQPDGSLRAVLTDFGIARSMAGAGTIGATGGQVIGTPDYMAPEQLAGKAAGPATDLFSFGILLYEMLTGEKPFPDDDHRTAAPMPPHTHNPEIPASWDALILRCLQTSIDARPQSVTEVLEAFEAPNDGEPPSSIARPEQSGRRRLVLLSLALTALVALFAAGSRFVWQQTPPTGEIRRVAVLPFAVPEEGAELQIVADGLMEAITSRLSQYEGFNDHLLVVPASEVRRLVVSAAADARGVLGVNYVVQGRVSAQDDRVRLTLTLIDAERMLQQDAIVINGDMARALDFEDNAISRLATILNLRVQPDHVADLAPIAPGAEEFYLQGKGYLQRSDETESVENAVRLFQKTIGLDPNHVRAHSDLALAYLFLHDRTHDPVWVERAEEASTTALRINGQSPEAHDTLGRVLLKKGEPEKAVERFREALNLAPRSADSYAGLGEAYSALKQYGQAEAAYRTAVSQRPGDWVSYKRLGVYYYSRGDYSAAAEEFKKVIDLTPDNAQGYSNLGVMQAYLERTGEAIASFQRAIELDPANASSRTNLGKLLVEDQQLEEAIKVLEEAAELDKRSTRTRENLASAWHRLGNVEASRRWYREAIDLHLERLELAPNDVLALSNLAHDYSASGEIDNARIYADRALRIGPRTPNDKVALAMSFVVMGQRDQARRLLVSALEDGFPREQLMRDPLLKEFVAIKEK